jgi:hypothetical protein
MISFEYYVKSDVERLTDISNRVGRGVRSAMQLVLDELVANIKGKFSDSQLADTVIGYINRYTVEGSDILVEGKVTSTWPEMVYHELGRPAGGKMPPVDAIVAWAQRKGITPDPAKTMISFAYAANFNRVNKRDLHALPVDVLVSWAEEKGITPTEDFAYRSMAFAMAKKIQREGIPGKHYFQQGLAETQSFIHNSFENVVIHHTDI